MKQSVNQIELYYRKTGVGAPLILLHGNGEDHLIFNELANVLAKDYTVYAIDTRNHGKSTGTKDFSYETMSADISDFMEALALEGVSLVGFSDGGIIGLLLGIAQNPRLKQMAVLGPNLSPDDFTTESMAYVRQEFAETGNPLFQLMMEQPNIPVEKLKEIQIPTLVIGAEHDIYQPELFPLIATTIPNAQLLIIEGHDHGSYVLDNDLLGEPLKAFFDNKKAF